MSSKHEFALYSAHISSQLNKALVGSIILLEDQALVVRITSILRLRPGERVVLFDQSVNLVVEILEAPSKKSLSCQVIVKSVNQIITPAITFVLPILKRDDFETALYSLVELGATRVQLVLTQKVQRTWGGEKEFERAQRIMVAAAEQSKNFAFPELYPPIALSKCLEKIPVQAQKIYFDVDGQAALSLLNTIHAAAPQELFLMVGPEGDLTSEEKELLRSYSFTFCVLTPTILRATQAVAVGLGMARTVLR
ncbi:MAG: RsmE family RNA methyltransferase [Candidatus Dependentiae bacterium]|nr:RsmE family RNA methyltransferase [Candidatus Dependentiae bacterium]